MKTNDGHKLFISVEDLIYDFDTIKEIIEELRYLSDWESFASLFIKTAKHRFQKRD